MKKEIVTHYSFLIAFFIFISVMRGWFELDYIAFWLGGVVGTLLPDVDHLIYIYFLRPSQAVSQQATQLLNNRNVKGAFELLAESRTKREKLIFHTVPFQLFFWVLAFLVITSSSSIFGRGLVLAFALHIFIDQVTDFVETKSLESWFRNISVRLTSKQLNYFLIGNLVVLLIFGFFL